MEAITAAEVEAWMDTQLTDSDRDTMGTVVKAVNATVTKWHGEPAGWTDRIHTGAVMLAAHLWRRRGTPAGVAAFHEDGVSYVQKSDPHVSMLLGLGGWTIPRVG